MKWDGFSYSFKNPVDHTIFMDELGTGCRIQDLNISIVSRRALSSMNELSPILCRDQDALSRRKERFQMTSIE